MRISKNGDYKNRATLAHRGLPPSPSGPLKRMFLKGNITLKIRYSSPDFQGGPCRRSNLSHCPQGHGHSLEGVSRYGPYYPEGHAVGADPCVRPPCRASVAAPLLWHSRPRLCKLPLLFCGIGGPMCPPALPRSCSHGSANRAKARFRLLASLYWLPATSCCLLSPVLPPQLRAANPVASQLLPAISRF